MMSRLAPSAGLLVAAALVVAGMALWSTAAALVAAGLVVGVVSVLFVDWGPRGKAD